MLDIKDIRERAKEIKTAIAKRGGTVHLLIDEILDCDLKRRAAETQQQALQSKRKSVSKEIGISIAAGSDPEDAKKAVKNLVHEIKQLEKEIEEVGGRQRQLLLALPNVPYSGCPEGADESSNPEIRTWGTAPSIEQPLNHVELAEKHSLIDFESGTKIAGSGYVVYRGEGARLERALIQFLLDLQTETHGYTEVNVPHLVNRRCMEGTGQLPKFEEDMYGVEDNSLFLAPTAEVPVTNLYRESLLAEEQLPIKLTAYTPCFRREAGSAGKDTKGIIRMHQFDKVELVQIVSPEQSFDALESLTGHAEEALKRLDLHYRVIELCTGDIGFSATKTYDIEVWSPGQNKYLEVSSCSNFSDYQARRMRLRYKDSKGRNVFCHTINGSGTALPRLYVALLEQCQQADGSIRIPEALRPYFRADSIGAQPAQ